MTETFPSTATWLTPLLVAALSAGMLTPLVRALARRWGIVAAPSADRWHEKPTALLGGIAIFLAAVVGCIVGAIVLGYALPGPAGVVGRAGIGILSAGTIMFVTGLIDDRFRLRPASKLILQSIAAAVLVTFGVVYPLTEYYFVNVLFTLFWFVGLSNALNLLDNMDGVAAGVAMIAALFLAVQFMGEGALALSVLCLSLAGAAAGFLPFNFHKASIFMGDSGSLFMGGLLAGLGAAFPATASGSLVSVLFVPFLIVIIPIIDTGLVTLTRTLAGRPISVGGRDHTTHRLVALGLSQRQAALLLYAAAASGGALAMVVGSSDSAFATFVGALFLIGLALATAYLARMHTYSPDEVRKHARVTVMINDLLYKRRAAEVVLDLVLFGVAYYGAYLLRWDGDLPAAQATLAERTLGIAIAAKAVSFWALGVYRGSWHQLTLSDAHRIARGALIGTLVTIGIIVFIHRDAEFARGVFVIDGLLAIFLALGARLTFRSLDHMRGSLTAAGPRALIYGAGRGGELLVRESMQNAELGFRAVGFLDDDESKAHVLLCGLPVLGQGNDLPRIARRMAIRKVIVGTRKLTPEKKDALLAFCRELDLELYSFELELREIRWSPAGAEIPA